MVTLARVLQDVCADPPSGCRSAQVRSLLHDFFAPKGEYTASHYWDKYRSFAHFLKLDRKAWPGALESLFEMEEDKARLRIFAFRSWTRSRMARWTRAQAGTERPCMYTLLKLAKERGLISWDYPAAARILENKAWDRVRPAFREAVSKYSDHMRRMNHQPESVATCRAHVRNLGEWLKARKIEHLKVTDQIAGEFVDWVISNPPYSDHYKNAILAATRTFYRWLRLNRLILENPFDGMGRFRVRINLPTVCSESEIL